jgi:hypothetical protein
MNTTPTRTRTINEIFRSDINGISKSHEAIDHGLEPATLECSLLLTTASLSVDKQGTEKQHLATALAMRTRKRQNLSPTSAGYWLLLTVLEAVRLREADNVDRQPYFPSTSRTMVLDTSRPDTPETQYATVIE